MLPQCVPEKLERLRSECETLLQQRGELLEELRISQEQTGTPVSDYSDKAPLKRVFVRLPSIPECMPRCPLAYRVPDQLSATLSTERAATTERLENEVEQRTREFIERMRARLLSSFTSPSYLCTCCVRPARVACALALRFGRCSSKCTFTYSLEHLPAPIGVPMV